MTPEILAQRILHAAGSGLRHYKPESKERIIEAATRAMVDIREECAKGCDEIASDYFIKGGMDDAPWNKGAVDASNQCAAEIRNKVRSL